MKAEKLIEELKKLGNKEVVITLDNKNITNVTDVGLCRDEYETELIVIRGADNGISGK